MSRKENISFYFSVEGETEKWYLEWLQEKINSSKYCVYKAVINCKVQKDPVSYVKNSAYLGEREIWHLVDYESAEQIHAENFKRNIDRMCQAQELKQVYYKLGYSNFTFDLWIILHKQDCFKHFTNRTQYIDEINKAFSKKFEDMHEYKHENNFKSLLAQCSLDDVIVAIERAKKIQDNNRNNYKREIYRGYEYYNENPSLEIWQAIEQILHDCKYNKP